MKTLNRKWGELALFLLLFMSLPSVAEGEDAKSIQLATNAEIEGEITQYLISEKLDGVRGFWDGEQLYTRSGLRIVTPDWFTHHFPTYPLDGELWMGRGTFEQVSGLVRRKTPLESEWKKVTFMVFDFPDSKLPFGQRYQFYVKALADISPYLSVIEQIQVANVEQLDAKLALVVKGGGEGLMLHKQNAFYVAGRNRNLIKLKPFYDAEATVIAHLPGKGQFSGLLGALLVETPEGLRFKIGTGFSLEERRQPPKLGDIITYKYLGLTQKGTPRFASFLRVRASQ
ncbi:DNA ligase [Shewanella nanhaiensis]|uniref:DNA ligase n=1 Tax=Shewanella nanhaiensis TaxID=2864872 RepID=A0ABS7E2D7_9GAMM|nr:DNA ligase [Shewanella nanhaiensis]MBW8183866.1 DNA ligase [Shewanella nanhaiensis]